MRIKQRVFGLLAVMAGLVLFQASAWAAGTASGTTISNVARVTYLSNLVSGDTVTGTLDTTVLRVGGDTLSDPGNQTMGMGDTRVFTYTFSNTGNGTDTFNVWVDQFSLQGGAANWQFRFHMGSDSKTAIRDTVVSIPVAADGNITCSVAVWAPGNAIDAPDLSFAQFKLVVASGLRPNDAAYVGDNGTTYSLGGGINSDFSWDTIASANITLVKAITSVTTAGAASMPKPGATILYTLTYNNSGSAAGDSVVVRDSIPINCIWDSASRAGTTLGATATLVDGDSGATGWQLQVTTNTAPNQNFYSVDYTPISSYGGAASAVKWVRWRRIGVAAAQTATLRFRVIIQ